MEGPKAKHEKGGDQPGDDESKSKRQKIEIVDESPDFPIKITDLANECLDSIFKHLDIVDLFSVGLSNKRLNKVANSIFKRKYGKESVSLGMFCCNVTSFDSGRLLVIGLKTCLQFLRCFAQSISKLTVEFDRNKPDQQAYVIEYMEEFCSESLIDLVFFNATKIPINNQTKPFPKVEYLGYFYSDLGEEFSHFNRWLPNLRDLDLHCTNMEIFAVHFPYLEHLIINPHECSKTENVADLLRQNPQLQSLDIDVDGMTFDQLASIVSDNHLITHLSVSRFMAEVTDMDVADLNKLAQVLPALAQLYLIQFRISADDAISCFDQFKSLTVFKFWIHNRQFEYLCTRLHDEFEASIDQEYDRCRDITLKRRQKK